MESRGAGCAANFSTLPFLTPLAQRSIVSFCPGHSDWATHDLMTQIRLIRILPWDFFKSEVQMRRRPLHFESTLKLSKGYLWTLVEKDFFVVGENKANSPRPRCTMEKRAPMSLSAWTQFRRPACTQITQGWELITCLFCLRYFELISISTNQSWFINQWPARNWIITKKKSVIEV